RGSGRGLGTVTGPERLRLVERLPSVLHEPDLELPLQALRGSVQGRRGPRRLQDRRHLGGRRDAGGTAGRQDTVDGTIADPLRTSGFSDKEQIWYDTAASSDFFGNVYVCYGDFSGGPSAGLNPRRLSLAGAPGGGERWVQGGA